MTDIFIDNIYIILLMPLWIFLIAMLGRFFSVYVNKRIIHLLTLMSSLIGGIFCMYLYKIFTPDKVYEVLVPFIKIKDFIINCGIHIDKLSIIFASVLFVVSFLIQVFSISYMREDKKQYRFFALLNLFNFSLLGLFFSPNLYQTYFFWEIAGMVSYLLIGFDYTKNEKSLASKKVFIINRIGDTSFLSAIIMCSYLLYEYAPSKSLAALSFFDMNTISNLICVYTSTPIFIITCILFVVAAACKSAQFPFYTWLQDAMAARLPVSALLHSSTLVALGVFLIIRMLPFFILEESILKCIALIGILTALSCSLSAIAQTNPKKVLAYSTSAQFGLMFWGIGVLNIKAVVVFFIAHALIKALLFITLPDKKGSWNYIYCALFFAGGLSLAGIIFAGLSSKELLLNHCGNYGITAFSLISFLTAFYIFRIAFVMMKNSKLEKAYPNIFEIISMFGLLMLNVVFYIYLRQTTACSVSIPFWAAIVGLVTVYVLSKTTFYKVPLVYLLCVNGFYLDKFYMTVVFKTYDIFAKFLSGIDTNVLGNYKPIIAVSKFGVKVFYFIECNIVNRVVKFISDSAKNISKFDLKFQNGNIQQYNLYALIIITAIITCLIIAYAAIIAYLGGIR